MLAKEQHQADSRGLYFLSTRLMTSLNTQQDQAVLEIPKTAPRTPLVEAFSKRISAICSGEAVPEPLIFLLFQREMMLRRQADPSLVSWANRLNVQGPFSGNSMLYMRYLLRKWLACMPQLFVRLSCLKEIHLTDEVLGPPTTTMHLSPAFFAEPDQLFERITTAFVRTIPFFSAEGRDLRSSTFLQEGSVFSMEEWWQSLIGRFNEPSTREEEAQKCIASRLAEYLGHPSCRKEPAESPSAMLVDILSQAEIHSYTG